MMRKGSKLSVGLACLCLLAAGGDALAKSHRRAPGYYVAESGRPLVVERRSFLDPGTQVPVGSTNRYMVEQVYLRQGPIEANQRSWYMNETRPHMLDQPWDPGLPIDFFP
jgi:hypothetical protein